jgi:hypothetical protein
VLASSQPAEDLGGDEGQAGAVCGKNQFAIDTVDGNIFSTCLFFDSLDLWNRRII